MTLTGSTRVRLRQQRAEAEAEARGGSGSSSDSLRGEAGFPVQAARFGFGFEFGFGLGFEVGRGSFIHTWVTVTASVHNNTRAGCWVRRVEIWQMADGQMGYWDTGICDMGYGNDTLRS